MTHVEETQSQHKRLELARTNSSKAQIRKRKGLPPEKVNNDDLEPMDDAEEKEPDSVNKLKSKGKPVFRT